MRIAWWSPLPPQPSGIADYSFEVLGELTAVADVLAVVDDDYARRVRAPEGVAVAAAGAYLSGSAGSADLDVYQMGNHPWMHAYMHTPALERPGVLVLHDPALVDFYIRLCGGADSETFLAEARANLPSPGGDMPTVIVDDRPDLDRLSLLMTRRLVEASMVTVVHSAWARDELLRRHPGACVRVAPHAVRAPAAAPPLLLRRRGAAVFGVFGGLTPNKRISSAVRAFAAVHRDFPDARLVVAGRSDYAGVERQLDALICSLGVAQAVRVSKDVSLERLEREIGECDVAIALRWPSAGETSAVVMRALSAGKPVIVSDLPQYRDFDKAFCWRVPTAAVAEIEAVGALMRRALTDPNACAAAGRVARRFVAAEGTLAHARDVYLEVAGECADRAPVAPRAAAGRAPLAAGAPGAPRPAAGAGAAPEGDPPLPTEPPGVNVIGDWSATTGLAEAGRRSATALIEAGRLPVAVVNHAVAGVPRAEHRAPPWLWQLPHGRPHPIEVWYLNVNEMWVVPDEDLRPAAAGRYVIGSWFWELPRVASTFVAQVGRMDEIWVGSGFVADAFRGHTAKPVKVMPCVVEPVPDGHVTRRDFGLDEQSCVFLFSFDANSFFARKNPWGVLQAFGDAFRPDERAGAARLVIKAMNLGYHPQGRDRLASAVSALGGLLVEDDLRQGEMHALIGLSDVYVSLHRSEGFGLGLAEAMYLGRPVVATAYSGNMDFTRQTNSCLVGYRLRPIDAAENAYDEGIATIYEAGQLWAEPDLRQAARWMRLLYERPHLRERVGSAGAATIRRQYSTAAAQAAMFARLEEVARAGAC